MTDRSFSNQREIVFKDSLSAGHVFGFAFDLNSVAAKPRPDVQTGFDQANIFIASAKQAFNSAAYLYGCCHLAEKRQEAGRKAEMTDWPRMRGEEKTIHRQS